MLPTTTRPSWTGTGDTCTCSVVPHLIFIAPKAQHMRKDSIYQTKLITKQYCTDTHKCDWAHILGPWLLFDDYMTIDLNFNGKKSPSSQLYRDANFFFIGIKMAHCQVSRYLLC